MQRIDPVMRHMVLPIPSVVLGGELAFLDEAVRSHGVARRGYRCQLRSLICRRFADLAVGYHQVVVAGDTRRIDLTRLLAEQILDHIMLVRGSREGRNSALIPDIQ